MRRAPDLCALLSAAALLATACGGEPLERPDETFAAPGAVTMASERGEHHADVPPASTAPADYSIYHLASTWRDRSGTPRTLASLAGRIQVVAMVYTSCGYACPRLILDMKRIESELGSHADGVGLVLASIDPARDTPERLAEFAEGARLDPERWTLLTAGDDDAVLELAAVLGVQYRRTDGGEFVHSNLLTVLDTAGVVLHRQEGLGADPSTTVAAIQAHIR